MSNSTESFFKSTVFVSFITTILVGFGIIIIAVLWTEKDWIEEKEEVSCFEEFQSNISVYRDSSFSIEEIDCFEWDSVVVAPRGSYRKHVTLNYKILRKNAKDDPQVLDWLDGDRNWTYILFYKNGILLNDAIAVPYGALGRPLNFPSHLKSSFPTFHLQPKKYLLYGNWSLCEKSQKGVGGTANVCSQLIIDNDTVATLHLPYSNTCKYRWELHRDSLDLFAKNLKGTSCAIPSGTYNVLLTKNRYNYKLTLNSRDSTTFILRK